MSPIIFNGKSYSSVDEMPPDIRQAYEQVVGIFADRNENGIPDIFEGAVGKGETDVQSVSISSKNKRSANMKRLPFPVIGLVRAGCLSTFIALVSIIVVGALAVPFAPEATFKLVPPVACPNGTVDYHQYHPSFYRPGEYEFRVDCVSADGTRRDITLQALGYVVALSYLACCVSLFIPLGLIGLIAPQFLPRMTKISPI